MLIVAHRTCPIQYPENSLTGIKGAAEAQADAVEVDVHLTRDGVPVLLHDPWPLRTARPPLPIPVRWLTASQFGRLRTKDGGVAPPTFAQAVDALPAGLKMAVDVKATRAMPSVIEVLAEAGRLDDAWLWTRTKAGLAHCQRGAPGSQRAYLCGTHQPKRAVAHLYDAAALGAHAVSFTDVAVDHEVIETGRQLGLLVFAWTRTLAAQDRLIDLGPEGLVTDWVAEARSTLGRA